MASRHPSERPTKRFHLIRDGVMVSCTLSEFSAWIREIATQRGICSDSDSAIISLAAGVIATLECDLAAPSSGEAVPPPQKNAEEDQSRVDDSQYPSKPLATAAGNEVGPGSDLRWLDEIEAQIDSSVPYYVPRLIMEIRHLERVIVLLRKDKR